MGCFEWTTLLLLVGVAAAVLRGTLLGRIERLDTKLLTQELAGNNLLMRLKGLEEEVRLLRERLAAGGTAPASATAAAPEPPPPPAKAPRTVTAPAPVPAAAKVPPPKEERPAAAAPPVEAPRAEPPAAAAPPPLPPPPRPEATPPPLRPVPEFQEIAPVAPPAPARPAFDWESLVGVRLFSWMAGIMLVIAAILFLRYSIQHGWLGAPVRMTLGLLTGAGLLAVCEWKAARRYEVTANALDAAGIAILFATFYASHVLWGLVGTGTAFLLMALVAAVAVALALRRGSPFIAVLGLLGGFVTPALLASGEDRPFALFGYLLLLNAGLAWVAVRRGWHLLLALSLAGTFLYQWGWVLGSLQPGRVLLALGIFLVFPPVHLAASALARRKEGETPLADLAAWSLGLPLLLAVYLAINPALQAGWLLFAFVLLLGAAVAVYSAFQGDGRLHGLAAAATVTVYALWLLSYSPGLWPGVLAFLAAEVLLYLGAPWVSERLGGRLPAGAGTLAAPLLLGSFPALLLVEPAAAAPGLTFGVLFLLLAAAAAFALVYESGWLHFGAALFAVAAEAVWAAEHLGPESLLEGLALFGVFGLFYLGVPVLARRLGRRLLPEGAGAVVLLLGIALLGFLSREPVAASAVWGLALLLALLNAGLFVEARQERRPVLAWLGVALSWGLVAFWWATVPLDARLGPALMLVTLLSVLSAAGSVWQTRVGAGEGSAERGVYLALVGHLFLLFVATRESLALPPWPLLGILALLVLAAGAAALLLRRGGLQVASLLLSHSIVLMWMITAARAPWTSVALAAEAALAAFGLGWILAARRREGRAGSLTRTGAKGAAAGLFAAQVVTLVSGLAPEPPPFVPALAIQAALLAALLALAWRAGWLKLAPWSVASSFVAVAAFWDGGGPFWDQLAMAAALLLLYLAYPLVLGARARGAREPWLAAVLASFAFFFLARLILEELGFGDVMGVLPVFQAAALAVLLQRLLALEPPGERDLGRLALVAGAVLAFLTLAVPLQLEKQWVTIGWALLAAALAWLYGRVPHRGLLAWTAGLAGAVFLRLALNPAVLAYHPRAETPVWNWYLYTYLVSAAALLAAARLLRRTDDRLLPALPRLSTLASAAAGVLLFLLLNIEIADWYSTGPVLTFGFLAGQGSLAEVLTYTLGWGIFALALLVTGIAARSRGTRIAAIGLLLGTVIKGFLFDLAALGGLYRVASFVGLAVCLAAVAVLMQRFVLGLPGGKAEAAE